MRKTKPGGGKKPSESLRPFEENASLTKIGAVARFPIVGIGASAGGLGALARFLSHVPKENRPAFVIVQHLDPTHKALLSELLQRSTSMPVLQIRNRMEVEPGHVYVIPPNRDLSILGGVLHLLKPAEPRGLRLPIDFFFKALADDLKERSIGVILSGMGSDGTMGLGAIKEMGGVVFVQDPVSAEFDSMPRAAIHSGLADFVAPVEELPAKIAAYFKHLPVLSNTESGTGEKREDGLEKVVVLLRAQTGHDFSLYKKSTLARRVERRMGLHQIAKIGDYLGYLRKNPQEAELLFKELLIGVTSFFRDPAIWEQLKNEVLPELLAQRPQGGQIRAWTAGCSTGEEAYSLAIIFREVLEKLRPARHFTLQIFATDLDQDAINKARVGLYPDSITTQVSEERLHRFFIKEEQGGYRIAKTIRESVIFAAQNLVMHPPFTKLDILTCRNLLIYFDAGLQKKLMPLFHYSLRPGGVLVLGSAETVGASTDFFGAFPGKSRIFRRLENLRKPVLTEFPLAFTRNQSNEADPVPEQPGGDAAIPNLQMVSDQVLLRHYAPASVLVNQQGDIMYVSGKTGKYLEPAAGKANWNLFVMAREGLRESLSEVFHRALKEKKIVSLTGLKLGDSFLDLTVDPVTTAETLNGTVIVVFKDSVKSASVKKGAVATPSAGSRLSGLTRDLQRAHEELQNTRDEMQTSQEELKSTNEELQSTNEELQSTNEELTTSKEEMQSMNEELQTVNQELQAKVDELSRTSNDMKNLLNSTDIAILFLDDALLVRRFTPQTVNLIKLIPGDAGRPITDIVTSLDYPTLAEDSQKVLRTLAFIERQVSSQDGRWFTVRIMPYRTHDNRIDGLVLTFTDTTAAKSLELALGKARPDLQADPKKPGQKR